MTPWGRAAAAALLAAGLSVLLNASHLGQWLIWTVGEEYALGRDAVVREPGGGVLLTNPGAMILWSIPFRAVSFALVGAGLWLALRKRVGRT